MKSQLNEGRINLNGMSYAEQTAAGTTTVVAAGTNTKGIKIALCGILPWSAFSYIKAGTSALLWGYSAGYVSMLQNVFVPPGQALILSTLSATAKAWVWYEVIT